MKWQIYPPWYWHLVVKNGNFTFLLLGVILADKVPDLPPQYWHLLVKNSNITILLLELILADEVADLPPWYWHLVVKNGNFIFSTFRGYIGRLNGRSTPTPVLASCGQEWPSTSQEWQFHNSTVRAHIGR